MEKRRLLCLLLAVCLLLGLSLPVSAAEETDSLEQAIIDACVYQREVSLSQYSVTVDKFKELYFDLYYQGALPWYVTAKCAYTYDPQTTFISKFTPDTIPDVDMALYEERVAQILDTCVLEGMSQWQIALSVHDYLIANAIYDDSLVRNTGYALLIDGTSVCAGYAKAYQDLMLRAGIDCRYVDSDAMDHAWNLVNIDGNWYHVDLTWDDPSPNTDGYVNHKYFLLTDEEISGGDDPHYDWDTDIVCADTQFADGFWRDVKSQICYESSDVSYLLRLDDYLSRIYRRNENTGEETLIYKEPSNYIDIGSGSYIYEHHGLTLRGGRLWFCSVSKVQSVDTDGSDLQTHFTNSGSTYIYGCHAGEDALAMTLSTHEGEPSSKTLSLDPSGDHIHSFTRTVVEPSDTKDGYTLSVCPCGIEARSLPTPSLQNAVTDSPAFSDSSESHEDEAQRNMVLTAVLVAVVGVVLRLGKKRK